MHMRGFTPEEDQMLNTLVETEGPRWKAIAEAMTAATPDAPRTAAMVRNRFLRVQKGKKEAEQGKARNKCGLCGQLKKGHVCSADKSRANTNKEEAMAATPSLMHSQQQQEESTASTAAETAASCSPAAAAPTPPRAGGLVLTPNPATAEADLPPIAESHLDVVQEQDENAYSNSSSVLQLFAPPAGLIGTCDSQAGAGVAAAAAAEMQLAASCWSPLTSPNCGVEPSPDITMASLLAPTPEGMIYSFPSLPASLQAALTGAGITGMPPATAVNAC